MLRGRILVALLLASPLPAQTLVVSPAPADTAVTLYRDPARSDDWDDEDEEDLNPSDFSGFALVTERRTVSIPAGLATVRFEGVAGNILPESAIVAGLASGVLEKNLDADLLSPRTLYDRMLGRRVVIRRTHRKTGRVSQEQAVIRSGAGGAGVLQMRTGHEALECSGLSEQLVYPEVPAGLSAKPTLSVRTNSPIATRATVTLSYLAGGFDWRADYTLTMRADGRADLFGWVTLASADVTSFPDAEVAAVAGRLNRDGERADASLDDRYEFDDWLSVRCWPSGANYGRSLPEPALAEMAQRAPSFDAAMPVSVVGGEDIVVTGARIARQEELGDLKLYRFPDRVTVAARGQKQVALLDRRSVPVEILYRNDVSADEGDADTPELVLKLRNRQADGLGLALPAGRVAVLEDTPARPVLLGEVPLADKAVGEELELKLPGGPGVAAEIETLPSDDDRVERFRLTVSNATARPLRYEARFSEDEDERLTGRKRLVRVDGRQVWRTAVPANGTAALDYEVREVD